MSGTALRGFTLVETVVALLLLSVSLLGMAAGVTCATRVAARGRADARLAQAIATRMDAVRFALATGGCAAAVPAGEPLPPGVTVRHEVRVAGSLAAVTVLAAAWLPGRPVADTMHSAVAC